jgi:Mg-chelatase subunit ChlD
MSKLKDFSIATARMMPVIILADVSGSMTAYRKLAALNRAIAETIAIFASEEDARAQIHRDRQKMLVSSAL